LTKEREKSGALQRELGSAVGSSAVVGFFGKLLDWAYLHGVMLSMAFNGSTAEKEMGKKAFHAANDF